MLDKYSFMWYVITYQNELFDRTSFHLSKTLLVVEYKELPDIGLSPSGKAQHFDCCIRWFESS